MYLEPVTKKWYPAKIVHLLDLIKTPDGAEYRRTQQHLKPCKSKRHDSVYKTQKEHNSVNKVPFPGRKPYQAPMQGRPKHDTKPPNKLDL